VEISEIKFSISYRSSVASAGSLSCYKPVLR